MKNCFHYSVKFVCLGMVLSGLTASALMTIQGYDPLRHERYANPNDQFIGTLLGDLDFSGVGKSSNRWATMISPSFFLSCMHVGIGSPITFTVGNVGTTSYSYTISGSTYRVGASDLRLGMLSQPVDGSVASYPLLISDPLLLGGGVETFSNAQLNQVLAPYVGALLVNYGQGNRVGLNILDFFLMDGVSPTAYFGYDTPGLGIDETKLASGDSGGPSFFLFNGQPVLAGIHYYVNPNLGEPIGTLNGSGDSFPAAYAFEIQQLMNSMADAAGRPREQLELLFLYPSEYIPEPASLALLALAALFLPRRRRWLSLSVER